MRKFSEWLEKRRLDESRHASLRPELDDATADRKFAVEVNDIVDLGPETQLQGKHVPRFAKIVEVRGDSVVALDLSKNDGTKILIPISYLHNKEQLYGRILPPADERTLKALGAKNLWIRLTPRQYKKFRGRYRGEEIPDVIPPMKVYEPSDVLKKMFDRKNKEEESPEVYHIFDKEPEAEKADSIPMFRRSPLQRFIKRNEE